MQERNDPAIGAAWYRPSMRGEIFRSDQIDRSINRVWGRKSTAKIWGTISSACRFSQERKEREKRKRERERDPDECRGGGSDVDYTERATHINKLVFTETYTRRSGRSFITIEKTAGYWKCGPPVSPRCEYHHCRHADTTTELIR